MSTRPATTITTASSVAVIIVTYNSADVIGDCLDSLRAALMGVERAIVIVVDNHSTDSTCALVEQHDVSTCLVRLARNDGYAAGINAGVTVATDAEALLLLNPDARLAAGSGATLLATLAMANTGIAVPKITEPDGSLKHSLRREPTVLRMWGEALLGGLRAGRFDGFSEIVGRADRYRHPCVVDWASGAVMLVARGCHDALGGWDESYFLYSEETDFCLRARDHGWVVRYTPDASAMHIGGHGERTPLRSLMMANRVELFRRWHGGVRTAAYRAGLAIHEMLRAGRGAHYRAAAWTLLLSRRPVRPRQAQSLGERVALS